MPIFKQLDVDWPMCHEYKITKILPSHGGASKTKISTIVSRNQVQTSTNMQIISPKSVNQTALSKAQQNLT